MGNGGNLSSFDVISNLNLRNHMIFFYFLHLFQYHYKVTFERNPIIIYYFWKVFERSFFRKDIEV